uniref:RRM domain-containing protein n=1 Tax=Neobodo designis TaxID=312471 RepID=A0A7S1M074_NEODS|mmetsp:Transcript_31747/g.98227  ORF Transcript_31747/g.98227 Transcript_31747/m.98227 type:complete len:399 (+) Transcript_31747:362-1558(+)
MQHNEGAGATTTLPWMMQHAGGQQDASQRSGDATFAHLSGSNSMHTTPHVAGMPPAVADSDGAMTFAPAGVAPAVWGNPGGGGSAGGSPTFVNPPTYAAVPQQGAQSGRGSCDSGNASATGMPSHAIAVPAGFVPVLLPNGQQAFVPQQQIHMAPPPPNNTNNNTHNNGGGAPVIWQTAAAPVFAMAPNASSPNASASVSLVYPLHDSPGNSASSTHQASRSGQPRQQQQQQQQRTRTPPPAPGEDERGPRQLIVNYLPPSASDRDLRQLFAQIGPVDVARISRDANGASKAFGFVYFRSSDDARRAIDALNGYAWLNKRIKVEWATQRGPHPPGTSRYRPPSVPDGYVPRGPTSAGASATQLPPGASCSGTSMSQAAANCTPFVPAQSESVGTEAGN